MQSFMSHEYWFLAQPRTSFFLPCRAPVDGETVASITCSGAIARIIQSITVAWH